MNKQSRSSYRLKMLLKAISTYPKRIVSNIAFSAIVVDSSIAEDAALDSRVRFYRSTLGRCSYVGRGSFIESTEVGAFCSIGGECNIGGGSHPMDSLSTSPVFYTAQNILKKQLAKRSFDPFQRTVIENDVWIGNGSKIKSGVRIATGAVVGMGSIVTKDIGPYEIWAGNPAKRIKSRFSEETIAVLMQSKWWEMSDEDLRSLLANCPLVNDQLLNSLSVARSKADRAQ